MTREQEQAKYTRAYQNPIYAMGQLRKQDAQNDLKALPCRGSLLDVGCGRGEMIQFARSIGFSFVHGVEVVPELIDDETVVKGEAHALPFADKSFDVVTLWDVIEHLMPGDDEAVCKEMMRVARRFVLLTANNKPSTLKDGTDLHINKRPYPAWDALFKQWFAPAQVTWIHGHRHYVSEAWRIAL